MLLLMVTRGHLVGALDPSSCRQEIARLLMQPRGYIYAHRQADLA